MNLSLLSVDDEDQGLEVPVKSFSHRGWDVLIYLKVVSPLVFAGHVDIFDGDIKRCCIALAGPLEVDSAIHALEIKSTEWVDEWIRRPHTGNTGFSEL